MTQQSEAANAATALDEMRVHGFADDVHEALRDWRDAIARDVGETEDEGERRRLQGELDNVERLMREAREIRKSVPEWPYHALFSPLLTGSDVLRAMVAHVLKLNGRDADTGRFGREEFALMMETCPDMERVMREVHGRMPESSDVLHLIHGQALTLSRITFENLPEDQRLALTAAVLERRDR